LLISDNINKLEMNRIKVLLEGTTPRTDEKKSTTHELTMKLNVKDIKIFSIAERKSEQGRRDNVK